MAEAGEDGVERTAERNISYPAGSSARDLLRTLVNLPEKFKELKEDEDEIELSLGLSLNGRFGVDPEAKKLTRSSSIPDFASPVDDGNTTCFVSEAFLPLMRTCSLPTEKEDEWRKRKELQSLRRMELKRKRSVKQRNSNTGRDWGRGSGQENGDHCSVGATAIELKGERGSNNGAIGDCLDGWTPYSLSSQGSIGSQGSASSVVSELESQKSIRGMDISAEIRSPASVHSLQESEQKPSATSRMADNEKLGNSVGPAVEIDSRMCTAAKDGTKNDSSDVLKDMPCVFTRGEGPNGRRVEGFLYRYRKGEEVRIMCVCHGSFHTPAEFVKHAGGGDVQHPLKHIVVNPASLLKQPVNPF